VCRAPSSLLRVVSEDEGRQDLSISWVRSHFLSPRRAMKRGSEEGGWIRERKEKRGKRWGGESPLQTRKETKES
jgi:hypothetical protein